MSSSSSKRAPAAAGDGPEVKWEPGEWRVMNKMEAAYKETSWPSKFKQFKDQVKEEVDRLAPQKSASTPKGDVQSMQSIANILRRMEKRIKACNGDVTSIAYALMQGFYSVSTLLKRDGKWANFRTNTLAIATDMSDLLKWFVACENLHVFQKPAKAESKAKKKRAKDEEDEEDEDDGVPGIDICSADSNAHRRNQSESEYEDDGFVVSDGEVVERVGDDEDEDEEEEEEEEAKDVRTLLQDMERQLKVAKLLALQKKKDRDAQPRSKKRTASPISVASTCSLNSPRSAERERERARERAHASKVKPSKEKHRDKHDVERKRERERADSKRQRPPSDDEE